MTATLGAVARSCDGTLLDTGLLSERIEVVDAGHDSRQIELGWLYCCFPGSNADGHDFASAAVEAGAAGLLVERRLDLDVPQILVPSTRAAMGSAAAEIHQHPSQSLRVVGVTGTNGKSSIVQLLADVLGHAGIKTDIIGTLKGARTTPEATDLQRLLRRAVESGCRVVAAEVSSHALSQGRINGTDFAVAVFTNLGRDHLDYHGTIEAYFLAKARLFTDGLAARSVINFDDEYGRRLVAMADNPVVTYRMAEAEQLVFDGPISKFVWRGFPIVLPLAGAHNVANALAAATCAVEIGLSAEQVAAALPHTAPVRGRFELVSTSQPFHVAVDYAHTPDALQAALVAARQVAGGNRVLVVFGCGGDRDAQKRPEMGSVAEKGADVVVVTSDNPRSEDPDSIIDAILSGIADHDQIVVEADRRRAIEQAMAQAQSGDVVLIAGKGHETYQVIGGTTLDFDDADVARQVAGAKA
jgi:UDP-N-acetylmuramoyl-L-alanyl-D-glutamate--2,6-diaminopimelate ligase